MESSVNFSDFNAFVESVKAKLPVNELYTKLTGEQFTRVDGRLRAKAVWREDKNPSLCYYPDKNLLTDFTVKVEGSETEGEHYNPLHILMRCGKAIGFSDALRMACELTNTEVPEKFKKKRDREFELPLNLGKKIIEVWEACRNHMDFMLDNPNKRPASMVEFFKNRNIPFDKEFIRTLNLGMCPDRQVVVDILKDSGIVRVNKKGEEEDVTVYRKELSNNALVFPLYNVYGGLGGLRFRQLDEKSFAQWLPSKSEVFYNANRFMNRPHDRYVIFPEGEMNVVAFGVAGYREFKDDPNVYQEIDKSLQSIFALGPKGSNVRSIKNLINKLKLIQDNDVDDYDSFPNPKDHSVLKTLTRISEEVDAEQLLVVDWTKLNYATKKFDLEDYLKENNYQISSLKDLPFISLPRYCYNVMDVYTQKILDEDLRRKVQLDLMFAISEKLGFSSKKIFEEICKKEFDFSDDIAKNVEAVNRDVQVGEYKIDFKTGRINKHVSTVDSNGIAQMQVHRQTNFYLQITNEIITFDKNNNRDKCYEVEIIINGKDKYRGEIKSEDLTKEEKVKGFCATTASFTDMIYYADALRGKGFSIITSLMQRIPNQNVTYYFSTLGRPSALTTESLSGLLKTTKYCLFPGASVIDGEVKENNKIEISLMGRKNTVVELPFQFNVINDDEFRAAGQLFWNHLRRGHDPVIVDSNIGVVFESCTRELQGNNIVENEHGFPLYIEGQSGCHKTTASLLAMSLIGKFYSQDQLIAWNATTLSVQHQLMVAGTATHTIDDLKVENLVSKDFINLFHSIYGGKTRTGMNTSGTEMHGGEALKCSVIITSEGKPADIPESIASRFLVIRLTKAADAIDKEREIHLDHLYKVFYDDTRRNIDLMRGFFPRMVAWAQRRGSEPYIKSLEKWHRTYMAELHEFQNNKERPVDMVTRIVSAFEQIATFCAEYEFCSETEAQEAVNNLVAFWKVEIHKQMKRIGKQSTSHKIVDILCQLIHSEGIGIKSYNGTKWLEPKQRGRVGYPIYDITYPEDKGGGRKLIIVAAGAVITAMNQLVEGGYQIIREKFEQDLKEMGVIETTSNGHFKQYPLPDDKTHRIDEKKLTSGTIVIDYHKLMDTHKRISS